MTIAKKKPLRRRKTKRRVILRPKAKIERRSSKNAKNDTLTKAPTKVPSNGAVFKVKIKRK